MSRIAHPLIANFWRDFSQTIRSPRLVGVSILFGFVIVGASYGFGVITLNPEEGAQIWQKGSDGALVLVAYTLVPIFLPIVPVVIGGRNLLRDWSTGFLPLSISKPVPKWGMAVGKFIGVFAAIALPLMALGIVSGLTVHWVSGFPLDMSLLLAYLVAIVALAALYLGLVLVLGMVVTPQITVYVALLAWAAFNIISPTAFVILGQFTAVIRDGEMVFQYAWADIASFSGLYHGLLAWFVPEGLDFIRFPEGVSGGGLLPTIMLWAVIPWVAGLLVVFSILLARIPMK